MKLIPRVMIKGSVNTPTPPPKRKRNNKKNTLPPDEYRPLTKVKRILVREDEEKGLKQFIEVSVKRYDDDEAPIMVFMQMYQESPKYTGYLKGKSVHYPLDVLGDVEELLQEVGEDCEDNNIY